MLHSFEMGGGERCVANLINHLTPELYEPIVVCLTQAGEGAVWLNRSDVSVIEVGLHEKTRRTKWSRLAQVLKKIRPTIVQSQNWGTLVETAVARRIAGAKRHIHVEQGTVLATLNPTPWVRLRRGMAMRCALACADACVAVADETRRRITKYSGWSASKIELIRNGVVAPAVVDAQKARYEIRSSLGIEQDAVVVGTVARLAPVKNLELMIGTAHSLVASGQPVDVVIVGDGPELDRLRQAAAGPAQKKIHLVGSRNDVGRWFAAMDIYVNCSVSEGTSLSLMEAMSAGLPSVVTDVGDSKELVGNGSAGIVVRNRDSDGLFAAIGSLHRDQAARDRLGVAAERLFKLKHDVRISARRYEKLYGELLRRVS